MANFTYSMTFMDGEGHKSNTGGYLVAPDHATAVTRVMALSELIGPTLVGKMVSLSIVSELALPSTNPGGPAADSDVELKAAFTFLAANNKRFRFSIPTIDRGIILGNSDQVDPTYANPIAAYMLANGFSDSNWSDLTGLVSVKEAYGRKR